MKQALDGLAVFVLLQAVFFSVLIGMAALERRNVMRGRARPPTVVPAPVDADDGDVRPAA